MDATPQSPHSPPLPSDPEDNNYDMAPTRRWARRLERTCCACARYFPLAFVYGLTTWAVFVLVSLCSTPSRVTWLGEISLFSKTTTLPPLTKPGQAGQLRSRASRSTFLPIGATPPPSSPPPAAPPTIMATAPCPHTPRPRPPPSPSSPTASCASAKSARPASPTAPTIAPPAAAACSRWTTTAPG